MPGALAALEGRATAHAGTPPAAEKRAAAREVLAAFGGDAERLGSWARWLARQEGPTAKELLCVILPACYRDAPEESLSRLQRLCDDGHWEVREWAAGALGELLDARFEELLPVARAWVGHESQFVRRAAVVGAMRAAQEGRPERAGPLLDLVEPLVTDRAEEVRRNLGPFAVGGRFLSAYPEETLARVRRWARPDDEQSRWNAAMAFSAAEAGRHVEAGLEVLSELARDQRRYVWQAVASALRNLVKRDPERVVPVLEHWLRDERRLPAALALRGSRKR